ncbi:MAG TPA: metallophosphoesterase [Polyangiaceae bacterium]|nr:metallophosphoesterase [Polyangiaceae bacterium]
MRSTLVVGDLHLSRHTPRAVDHDLCALLGAHGGARVIFVGDFFDLSAESPRLPHDGAIAHGFEAHPEVRAALARHVESGGEAVWLAGNHDPELGERDGKDEIARALGLSGAASVRARTSPWFFRDGGLHVEHGHLYDADNAPAHPLASPRDTLGVHFVEEFIAPTGAFSYLNTNDKTPLELFTSAFRLYGRRGPYVVYRYFHAAFSALGKSGPFAARPDAAAWDARLADFLVDAGLDGGAVERLVAERAAPTMHDFRATLARLYLDRVAATVAVMAGLAAFAAGQRSLGLALGGAGLGGLALSWSRGHDRYGGKVSERLDDGARRVARATGAKLVVLGHAHAVADRDGYSNTASFAFPRGSEGRPFVQIEGSAEAPRAARRFWPQRGAGVDGAKTRT